MENIDTNKHKVLIIPMSKHAAQALVVVDHSWIMLCEATTGNIWIRASEKMIRQELLQVGISLSYKTINKHLKALEVNKVNLRVICIWLPSAGSCWPGQSETTAWMHKSIAVRTRLTVWMKAGFLCRESTTMCLYNPVWPFHLIERAIARL